MASSSTAVGLEVILAAQPVVVDPGGMRGLRIEPGRGGLLNGWLFNGGLLNGVGHGSHSTRQ
jgi:hypothetical protein